MNREIKFRAWDALNKEMRYSDKHDGEFYVNLNGVLYFYKIPNSNEYFKSYDVMQYTGLKDKNGVGIYEGDIIEYTQHHFNTEMLKIKRKVVCWKWDKWGIFETKAGESDIKVIGNIYENSELLKQSKCGACGKKNKETELGLCDDCGLELAK